MSSFTQSAKAQRVSVRFLRNGQEIDLRELPFRFRKVKLSKLVYEPTDPNLKTLLKIETGKLDQTIIRETTNANTSNVLFFVAPLIGNGATNVIEVNREDNGYDYEFESELENNATSFSVYFYEGNTRLPDAHFQTKMVFLELIFIH